MKIKEIANNIELYKTEDGRFELKFPYCRGNSRT